MARRRYNGLKTTLGASLTNSATSVTFAAALTHSNGTNVPTLAGSDYIPLTIFDTSGNMSEIVWLTAYTSGATTGTIARGKEGTTGVAHSTGDRIGEAVNLLDLTQNRFEDGSDTLWGTPLAYDVEFDDDDTSGTLPSGWSWVNQGTSTYKQQWGAAILTPQTSSSDRFAMVARNLPTESTWEATTRISLSAPPTNWYRAGIVLRESSSGKFTFFGQGRGNSWFGSIAVNDWTNSTTFSGNEVRADYTGARYFKIKRNSGPTYDFLYSEDGASWGTLVSAKSPFATYDQIGFAGHALTTSLMAFHFLRVR